MKKAKQPPARCSKLLYWAGLLLLSLLLLPVLHVGLYRWSNIPWSPMQWQRAMEDLSAGRESRNQPIIWQDLSSIPIQQMHFIWASEDQQFFNHRGIDWEQLRDSVKQALEDKTTVRGSSTITMQCARSVFLWQGRSYVRKALEAYYTLWMEFLLNKPRILELYLNHIEMGPGIYGLGSAARYHFQKAPQQLTEREMSSLAAILPNPREWSPVNPDAVVQRKIRRVERLAARSRFPTRELDLDSVQK